MENIQTIILFAGLYIFWLAYLTEALDLEKTYEGACTGQEIAPDPNLNKTWVASHFNWYITAGSKSHLYRVTQHHFGGNNQILKDMPEHTFYYESCIHIKGHASGQGVMELMGFEPGQISLYNITIVDKGAYDMTPIPYNTIVGRSTHYLTLTDNKSFLFFTNCYENRKSWDVTSLTDTLSPEAIQQIEVHAVKQGFDKKQFVFLKFNSCKPGVIPQPGRETESVVSTSLPPFHSRKNMYANSHFGRGASFKRILNRI